MILLKNLKTNKEYRIKGFTKLFENTLILTHKKIGNIAEAFLFSSNTQKITYSPINLSDPISSFAYSNESLKASYYQEMDFPDGWEWIDSKKNLKKNMNESF